MQTVDIRGIYGPTSECPAQCMEDIFSMKKDTLPQWYWPVSAFNCFKQKMLIQWVQSDPVGMKAVANRESWGALKENWQHAEVGMGLKWGSQWPLFLWKHPKGWKVLAHQQEREAGLYVTLVPLPQRPWYPPRREERPHQTNRGRNNIFSLPGQEGYVAWTRRPSFPSLGLDLFKDWTKKQVAFLLFTSTIPWLPTQVGFTEEKWVFIKKGKRLNTQLPRTGKYPLLHAKPCTMFLIRCDSSGFKHVRNSKLDEKGLGRDQ